MDELKIKSKFMTTVLSNIIQKMLRKKLGSDIAIKINDVTLAVVDGQYQVHLEADCGIKQGEITKLLKNIGLD